MDDDHANLISAVRSDPKVSKTAAGYQDAPKGRERCGRCEMFQAPMSCSAVLGRVSAQGWCRYYEAR